MAAVLEVPPDLAPRVLVYQDELPTVIAAAIKECSNHWQRGDADKAIQCTGLARTLARANNHPVGESVACVWMADLYRELSQLGPALECCRGAINALRLRPNYEHRDHAEAVIYYLRGLLHHALGANTEALADYQRALTSFEKGIEHWNSNIARNPTQVDKCEKATRWINVLCRCLTGDLSSFIGRTEMQIPATDGQDYELARLELAAYLIPPEVIINGQRYCLHHPDNGIAFAANDHLEVMWNARHFAVRVPEDRWAGEHSARGDYTLVRRERKAVNPTGAGVLWDSDQQQWRHGTLIYNPDTGRLWFRPFHLIGGAPQDEEVEDQGIGVVRALLKPT